MDKFQNTFRIASARAEWYDYNEGQYFITICTEQNNPYFGEVIENKMILNSLGNELFKQINGTPLHNKYAVIQLIQIMPNHVHLIIHIEGEMGWKNVDRTDVDADTEVGVGADTGVACRDVACRVSTNHVHLRVHVCSNRPAKSTENKMREIAENRGKLSTTIGSLKSSFTNYANKNGMPFGWQSRFHDRIIRDENEYYRIWNYIVNNPANWTGDEFFK